MNSSSAVGPGLFVSIVTVMLGAFMFLAGIWALLAPASFADFTHYTLSEHFVHDAGAFQIGIGITLVMCFFVRDSFVVGLAGYFVSNSIHAVNHALDMHLGGHAWDAWLLGSISLITAAALLVRMRAVTHSANSSWER